jgi:hypothetical protein
MKTGRGLLITAFLLMASIFAGPNAQAQTTRFQVGPVARIANIGFENSASGNATVTGLAARVMLTSRVGIDGDLTTTSSRITRSYEGTFISYAQAGASREEIERMGVVARRDLHYVPGLGGSLALTGRTKVDGVTLVFRIGGAARRYVETSDITILRVPEGIDPRLPEQTIRDERRETIRSGILFGVDAPMRVTRHIHVAPEFRAVLGGTPDGSRSYHEVSLGARVSLAF